MSVDCSNDTHTSPLGMGLAGIAGPGGPAGRGWGGWTGGIDWEGPDGAESDVEREGVATCSGGLAYTGGWTEKISCRNATTLSRFRGG